MLRVTARVLRFVEATKGRRISVLEASYNTVALEAVELNQAEVIWIRSIQTKAFQTEIAYLTGSPSVSKSPCIDQFHLFLDDHDPLRCKGRVTKANLSESEKNPILLLSKHWFVRLLIIDMHYRIKHGGINDTLVALRERYWIQRGRQAIKSKVRSCVVCKKLEGPPYCAQPPPDLPA